MDSGAADNNSDVIRGHNLRKIYQSKLSSREGSVNEFFGELAAEVRDDLFNYLDRLGLVNESGMLVIPSTHHYFYDADDLKGVKTIVNLKQLNYVREIRNFLKKVAGMLPQKSNFVGCFVDNDTQNGFADKYSNLPRQLSEKAEVFENGIESRIPFINRMYSFIDSRTNRYLTRRTVSHLLEESGLQLVGMSELNGLTYFCSRKISDRIELIA
ncbi:MAG TPA: hypothetical protein VMV74_04575 [Bacteroidales bacterium]|nr:hypothetical protein [Bacteroidales bacterium]